MLPKYTERELRRLGFVAGRKNAKFQRPMPELITNSEYERLPQDVQVKYKLDDNVDEAFEIKLWELKNEL